MRAQYAVYVCMNQVCDDGEFAARVPPIYVELPSCPECGCQAILTEVLWREGEALSSRRELRHDQPTRHTRSEQSASDL